MKNLLEQIWWGNSIKMYAIVLAEIIIVWILFRLFRKFIFSLLKKISSRTESQVDDAIVDATEKFIIPYFYLIINYGIIQQLSFSDHAEHVLKVVVAIVTAYYFIRFINHALHLSVLLYMKSK